jgi:two-component system chemotaxis sensor kinase CheA
MRIKIMDKKEEEFLKKLLSLFKVEAEEHIKAMSSGLIELEKAVPGKQQEIVEIIYREAHSLKGAARSVNLMNVASLCQSLESVFSAMKTGSISASAQIFDVLHRVVDTIGNLVETGDEKADAGTSQLLQLLDHIMKGSPEKKAEAAPCGKEPIEQIKGGSRSAPVSEQLIHPSSPAALTVPSVDTIRISTSKLDAVLLLAEELLTVKIASGQRVTELRELKSPFDMWKKEIQKVKRPDFMPYPAALDTQLSALQKSAEYDHRTFGSMVDDLLEEMKKALMQPFSSVSHIFPKFVRDLSRDMGKEVEITITGDEIEVDRRILEEMRAPLIHLVRNCIDHGIEKIEERRRKEKSTRGTIELAVTSGNGGKLEIVISDDGMGINTGELKSAAVHCGIIAPEEAEKLSDQDALGLMYHSGVTTSPIITDISGRGLGLAIVHEKVEKLGGMISVDTKPDRGTTFRMVIPLTLATFRGVLVQVGEQQFILPSTNVERIIRAEKKEIKTVENRETFLMNGQVLSLTRMGDVLGIAGLPAPAPGSAPQDLFINVVILGAAEKRIAFLVDEVREEREVLVKSLGKQLSRVRNVAGATVLGSGKVVPILNVGDLMKSAVKAAAVPTGIPRVEVKEKKKAVLVVEDSITARTLLKNILYTAGYDVKTAVDGVDAVSFLRTEKFDLVVSDIQMPRMDGFDLVKNIRGDKKLSELPIVLVTGLESNEDRRRGIDVGANAYIVKSSFDQSNLLEVVGRLI